MLTPHTHRDGGTPLHYAAQLEDSRMTKGLLGRATRQQIDTTDKEGRSPLLWAVADGKHVL